MTPTSSSAGQGIGLSTRLRSEKLLAHNSVVAVGTMAAGLLGVAFQSLVSHQFKPADFGSVFAVLTLITFIGLPASGFSLLMARETSRGQASGHHGLSASLLRQGNRALMLSGTALACVFAIGSPLIARLLAVPTELLVVAALGLPFGLAMPLLMGEFQGEQRFLTFSVLVTGQAAVKLVAAISFGLFLGPLGVVAGISLASITSYLLVNWMLRTRLSIRANLPWWRPAAKYLVVVLPSTLSLSVLLSADVLVAKHFFPTNVAGEYSAVAALGRAIFWGASGVATVLFPKVVFRATHGSSGSHLVAASLALVLIGGVAGFTFLSVGSRLLLTAFAGSAYAGANTYLPWYALGMTFLGGVAVLVATHQSHGRKAFLGILVPLAALEPILLVTFHSTVLQLVQTLDLSVGLILISLGILYVLEERARAISSIHLVGNPLHEQHAIEMITSR